MKGKQIRLRRLFPKGKTLIVPMDHPVYYGALPGIEDPRALVRDVAATPADGVLLTLATLERVADDLGGLGTIARLDGTHTRLGSHLIEIDRVSSVEYAVACGADAAVLNIYVGADNERDLLRKLGETAEACDRWGLPLVGEMIPMAALAKHYGKKEEVSEAVLADQIALASRVGAELGADVIKTNYTGSVDSFRKVVEAASVPVVVAGGPAGKTVNDLLRTVEACMEAGAAGICMGRNVWGRPNRREVLGALSRIVHGKASAEDVRIDE